MNLTSFFTFIWNKIPTLIIQKPEAYREIEFCIDGKKIKIAGLSHPVRYSREMGVELVCKFLVDRKYTALLSLDEKDKPPHDEEDYARYFNQLEIAWKAASPTSSHLYMKYQDDSDATIEMFIQFIENIKLLSTTHDKIAVHCGAGNGRTGTMLTALAIYLDLNEKYTLDSNFIYDLQKKDKRVSGSMLTEKGDYVPCTDILFNAIKKVRSVVGGGESVEDKAQIVCLQKFEQYLVEVYFKHRPSGFTLAGP